ncbi:MAG: hypothetical protein WB821_05290 [Burkholderiaceae bacterium]
MKFVLASVGSVGDALPYIALGRALSAQGHPEKGLGVLWRNLLAPSISPFIRSLPCCTAITLGCGCWRARK